MNTLAGSNAEGSHSSFLFKMALNGCVGFSAARRPVHGVGDLGSEVSSQKLVRPTNWHSPGSVCLTMATLLERLLILFAVRSMA